MQFKEIEFLLNLLPSKNNDRNKNSRGKNGTPLQYFCWKNPWTEEPGGLQSMGSRRVRHNWLTSLSLFTFMHWRRRWQPTPVFLPGESQGRGSLVGCHLWGRTESDTTEATYSSRGKKKNKLAQLLQTTCICIYQCSLKSNSTHPKTSNSSCMIAFIYSLTSICWTLINTM